MAEQQWSLLREGYLSKIGEFRRTWKRRWFVVRHDSRQLMFQYSKSPDKREKPLGVFHLGVSDSFRLVEPPLSPLDKPVIEISTDKRKYLMTSETEQDIREWAWAIERAVGFLQQQAKEPEEQHVRMFHAGTLKKKKGGQRRNWKARWFVLRDRTLSYYSSRSDQSSHKPRGVILLDECREVARVFSPDQHWQFRIRTSDRLWMLRAGSEAELMGWLSALEKVGCDVNLTSTTAEFYTDEYDTQSDDEDAASTALSAPVAVRAISSGLKKSGSSAYFGAAATSDAYADDGGRRRSRTTPNVASQQDVHTRKSPAISSTMTFEELHAAFRPQDEVVFLIKPKAHSMPASHAGDYYSSGDDCDSDETEA